MAAEKILAGDTIDFMRLAAAEARRFPELVDVGHTVRERVAETATQVLSNLAGPDEIRALPALSPDRLHTTTRFFLDLTVSRLLMRALLGENPKSLRAEIAPHVAGGVSFFLAACRHCFFR